MIKVIILGCQGMLGNYIYKYLQYSNEYQVVGISRNKYDVMINSFDEIQNILQNEINDNDDKYYVINCIGLIPHANKNYTITDRMYIKINSIFPQVLSQICSQLNFKLIHPTTDCVFTGNKSNYNESDYHDETSIYGISKSLGEPNNCMVIRTSIIGEEIKNKRSLIEWVKSNKNGNINGYTNHYWNGITCLEFSKIIDNIIQKNIEWIGIRHIFSPNSLSKYQLLILINEIYDLNIKIEPYQDGDKNINKTLNTIYDNPFIIKDLDDQIKDIKIFNIL